PSRAISRSILRPGNSSVPLNCMCSTQWETPVFPVISLRDPARYQSQWLMIGAVWISFSSTLRPLSSCVLMIPSSIKYLGRDDDYFHIPCILGTLPSEELSTIAYSWLTVNSKTEILTVKIYRFLRTIRSGLFNHAPMNIM